MRILICVAGVPYARPTLQTGHFLAELWSASVTLLTIVKKPGREKQGVALLQKARAILDLPDVTLKTRQGHVVDEIEAEMAEGGYDVIVVGEHIFGGLLDGLLPTIPHRVAQASASSVLVVHGRLTRLARILVCTSGQARNRPVVEAAARLAQAADAAVRLLHVTGAAPGMYSGLGGMEESLPALLQSPTPLAEHLHWCMGVLREHDVAAQLLLRTGIVADEIVREAREGGYDLLVAGGAPVGGPPATGALRQLLIAPVMPALVDRAPCSVLIVHQEADAAPDNG